MESVARPPDDVRDYPSIGSVRNTTVGRTFKLVIYRRYAAGAWRGIQEVRIFEKIDRFG
jgi:hypothetical protein